MTAPQIGGTSVAFQAAVIFGSAQPAWPQLQEVPVSPAASWQEALQYLLPSSGSQLQAECAHFAWLLFSFPVIIA